MKIFLIIMWVLICFIMSVLSIHSLIVCDRIKSDIILYTLSSVIWLCNFCFTIYFLIKND